MVPTMKLDGLRVIPAECQDAVYYTSPPPLSYWGHKKWVVLIIFEG